MPVFLATPEPRIRILSLSSSLNKSIPFVFPQTPTKMFKSISRTVKKLTEEAPQGNDQMIVKVKRLDSRFNRRGHQVVVDSGTVPAIETDTYDPNGAYVMVHCKYFNQLGLLHRQTLDIKSLMVKKVLKEVIGDSYPGISFNTANIVLEYPLRCMWYYRDDIRAVAKEDKKSEKGRHLKLLLDFLDSEFATLDADYRNYMEQGLTSFDLMWTLFKPGELVYTSFDGHARVFESKGFKEQQISCAVYGVIDGTYIDYNGEEFGHAQRYVLNPDFEGTRKITELDAFPLQYHPREKEVRLDLISRGRKFESLAGIHCMDYSGPTISGSGHWGSKLYVNGRVMVDVKTHVHYHPDKAVSITSFNSDKLKDLAAAAKPQFTTPGYHNGIYYEEVASQGVNNVTMNVTIPTDGTGQDLKHKKKRTEKSKALEVLTDSQLLLCSSLIYGFALNEKQWVQLFVDNLQPVRWNVQSFDQLVLPTSQKQLVKALVESHQNTNTNFDDFIAGKGRGLICCLHGSPGCGKTMTAESVAEFTKSPLYTISAGDLGADPAEMEKALSKILRLCTIWNAVLLLDEADVFLEERSLHDLGRNALVSIFLRMLEYYSGILFLTTNRVKTFDEAFQSRIHVALRYRDLDKSAREQVWRNFIKKIEDSGNVTAIKESDYDFLGSVPLNGRQIKNAARTALSLAENMGDKLSIDSVKSVLGIVEAFERDFKELKNVKQIEA
ncbi:hypothetical protein H072_10103 [Dactylellina haptotyla CBS 200.50]|uniref:AAA+ ATPase domain-containing protein n=1 Tax=Dactylellina haptotyla (strain CBS 200.50) TaxID=1284197 RepID=S8A5J8_DACHA|nr:hypothetical protein H072_10103 [Dactylellina haptotyla CBS 200.50]